MQEVLTIIQTVGFPIACAVGMFLMLQSEQKTHKEEIAKLNETLNTLQVSFNDAIHEQETAVATAINNNTLVIQKLIVKLDKEVI